MGPWYGGWVVNRNRRWNRQSLWTIIIGVAYIARDEMYVENNKAYTWHINKFSTTSICPSIFDFSKGASYGISETIKRSSI